MRSSEGIAAGSDHYVRAIAAGLDTDVVLVDSCPGTEPATAPARHLRPRG